MTLACRIVKVGLYLLSRLEYGGGGERTAIELGNFLTNSGMDVTVCYSIDNKDLSRIRLDELEKIIRFKYKGCVFQKFIHLPISKQLYHPLPKVDELLKNEVSMIFLYRIPPRRYLRELSKRRVKVIFLLHGIGISNSVPWNVKIMLYCVFEKISVLISRRFLNTPTIRMQCLTYELLDELINLGVSEHLLSYIPTKLRNYDSYKIENELDTFRIIFIGRLERLHKGLDLLLKIIGKLEAKKLKNIEFLIIGNGTDSDWLINKVSSNSIVRFYGYVSDERKMELLSSSHIMVITSYLEPLGLTVMEGIASGLRVFATPSSGPKQMLSAVPSFGEVLDYKCKTFVKEIIREYDYWRRLPYSFLERRKTIKEEGKRFFDETYDKLYLSSYEHLITQLASTSNNPIK